MNHVQAFLKALTPHEVLWGAVALAVLLVLGRMSRAVGHLAKAASKAAAAPVAAASGGSGGSLKLKPLLLAGALIGGAVMFARSGIRPSAGHSHAAPAPVPPPSPQPTVTTTVTPHAVTHFVMPHLSGGVVIGIFIVGAVVAITLLGPLLRRSS